MNDPQTHPIATHFIMLHPTAISSFPSPTSKPNKIICTPKFNMERQKCWFWKKESPNSFWCHFQVQKGKNLHKKSRKNPILEYLFISILNFKPNFFKKKIQKKIHQKTHLDPQVPPLLLFLQSATLRIVVVVP